MEQWFRANYEDPVHHMPVERGEYQYPFGGPYDAANVLHNEYDGIVPDEFIGELASRLEGESPNWAPVLDMRDEDAGEWADHAPAVERPSRAEILRRLEAAEAALTKLAPQHGGIGHNNPPDGPLTAEEHREATAAVAEIRAEVAAQVPDRSRLRRAAEVVGRAAASISRWLAKRVEVAVDEAIKISVKATVVLTTADITGASDSLRALADTITRFVQGLGGP
ncbi:hypothetical protein [Teichococcus aestuarii]|uniref:hypothetical protein n=1 Tax=Teichococcus aestuarii TaxID=568898 RepID=UPI0011B1CC93|nr:hypothetical protein [Pseudoroseomonas aestuarii]